MSRFWRIKQGARLDTGRQFMWLQMKEKAGLSRVVTHRIMLMERLLGKSVK